MENQNTGSFGAAIGGGSAIAEAMGRRGMGGGVLQQTSPMSAQGPGATPPTVDGGQHQPVPAGAGSPPASAGSPGMAPGSFESQVIIKALDSRLKSLSKIEEAQVIPQLPQGGF
jgi:hypothetical protein